MYVPDITRRTPMIRLLTTTACTILVGTALAVAPSAANAAPKSCPPGQTATVSVIGNELVTTCRIL
jgi:hypothetical protein